MPPELLDEVRGPSCESGEGSRDDHTRSRLHDRLQGREVREDRSGANVGHLRAVRRRESAEADVDEIAFNFDSYGRACASQSSAGRCRH